MNVRKLLTKRQELAYALRILMGYPRHRPMADPVSFSGAGPLTTDMAIQIGTVAEELGRDIVVLHFDVTDESLQGITLAIRETASVRVFARCRLYAVSETAPLQILTEEGAWRVGARNQLALHRSPPAKRLARGSEIAHRRWKVAVEQMGPLEFAGGRFVPAGGTMATSLDMNEAILLAAAA